MASSTTAVRTLLGSFVIIFCASVVVHAQTPPRELDVPSGTVVTGLGKNGMAFSNQTVWVLSVNGAARTAWTASLGINVADVGSDGQNTGARFILQSDGSLLSFNVYETAFSTPAPLATIATVSTETYKKILGNPLIVLTSRHLYASQNGGVTWAPDTAGFGTSFNNDVASDSGLSLVTVTTGGIYRRGFTDATWVKDTSLKVTNMSTIFIDRKRRMFIGVSNQGVYGSVDHGVTWTRDSAGMGARTVSKFNDDAFGNVYAVTDQGQRVYRTGDGGQTWTRMDASIISVYPDPVVATTFYNVGGDSLVYCATVSGLFTSTDHGVTWGEHNAGMVAENIGTIEHVAGGRTLVTTDLGVFKRESGDSVWTRTYPSSGYLRLGFLYLDGSGAFYVSGPHLTGSNTSARIVLKSVDKGNTWVADTAGLSLLRRSGTFFVDERGAQHMAVNGSGGGGGLAILYSKPAGGSWGVDTVGFVSTAMSDAATAWVSNGSGQLFLSGVFSGGNTWTRSISGGTWSLDTAGADSSRILAMRRDPNGNIVAGARNGRLFRRSSGRWNRITVPTGRDTADAYSVSVDSTGALVTGYRTAGFGGFFTTPVGAYITKDAGVTWHFGGLQNSAFTNLVSYGDTTYAMVAGRGAFRMTSHFAPTIHLAFRDLSFGTVNVGEISEVALSITNSGTDTLRISALTVDLSVYVPRLGAMTIAPGVTVLDTIRFAPVSAGVATGTVTIVSNASTSPDHATLQGVGRSSNMQLSSRQVTFGSVRIGRPLFQTVTITNHGADSLRISAITGSPVVFTSQRASIVIAPGASFTDTLRFIPAVRGAVSGTVVLRSNSPSSPDTIQVSGSGTQSSLSLHSRNVGCGTIPIHLSILTMFTITNNGTDTLNITSISSTNSAFTVIQVSTSIPPGQVITDTIIFTPTVLDTNRGNVVITSDAPTSPDTMAVHGNGTPNLAVNEATPSVLTLGEAYPNPVRDAAEIPFTLARSGRLTVSIVDALGRHVAEIMDGTLDAGTHAVHVNSALLPNYTGAYFVEFRGVGIAVLRRLVVIR